MSAFLKSFTTVSSFTLISRFLGYGRELLIASVIGPGALSDAFFVALRLPNLFRRLFAEGAFNVAFIPLFSSLRTGNAQKAVEFFHNAFSALGVILLSLCLAFEFFMPYVIDVIAPGFEQSPLQLDQTIFFARLTFPYILFISLTALLSGVLNTFQHFAAASIAPILLNLIAILTLVLFSSSPLEATTALAWSVLGAGAVQFLWVFIAFSKALAPQGYGVRLRLPSFDGHLKKLFKKMGPGLFGSGIAQFNMFVSDIIASFIPTAISYLAFADRINQFPLGIIGAALGTVLLPLFSTLVAQDDRHQKSLMQNKALEFALFLSVPACAALFFLAPLGVEVLYERGRFDHSATLATAACLQFFVLGLPAYVLVKVLSSIFFAHSNTKTPVKIGSMCIVLNILLNLLLIQIISYKGIALATSISFWVNALWLWIVLVLRKEAAVDSSFILKICGILCATLFMLLTLFLADSFMPLKGATKLALLVGLGGASYVLLTYMMGVRPFKK